VQDRPRKVQKNKIKNRAVGSKEVDPLPQALPVHADHLSYGHAEGDYFPSYFDAGLSGAGDIACEGGQSHSPPQAIVNYYPTSARTTINKSSLPQMADSRSVMPGTKPRMIMLLIEDRRYRTDELAEVHVSLKAAGEGYLGADVKDVCVDLQSGPSRVTYRWCMYARLLGTRSN
jgi:hypothetical protein